MQPEGPGIPGHSRATLRDAQEIVRQAKRYCPNLPFDPSLNEVYEIDVAFYEDYRLVRLAPAEVPAQEFYGFYAPGDFRPMPIEVNGRAFNILNAIAPLMLNSATVKDYALLRLSFQLPAIVQENSGANLRLARTIRSLDELNIDTAETDNTKLKRLRHLIADPEIEMIKEWDPHVDVVPASVLRGKAYRVSATMMVHLSANEGQLIQVLVQIDPLGSTVIRTDTKGSETFAITPDGLACITTPRHTATAMPIWDWENLDGDEFNRISEELNKHGVERAKTANNADLVVRKSTLPFYARYKLLEVLRWNVDSYKRSYAVFKPNGDDILIVPLTGKSPVIRAINAEEGELSLTHRTADEYLRFFCWAVRGEEGPFYIPRTFREIPIKPNLSGAEQAKLKQRDFSLVEEVDLTAHNYSEKAPNAKFWFRATVVYEADMFEAWFAIENSGMVLMVEANALASFPIQTESELGEEFLKEKLKAQETGPEDTPKEKTPLSLAQNAWLYETLTRFREIFENFEEDISAATMRNILNVPANQPFIAMLEKLWPNFPPISSPNSGHEFIGSLLSPQPSEQTVNPKEIAPQLTLLAEGLLPAAKVSDITYFCTGKREISAAQITEPMVFRSALFKPPNKNQHNDDKQ